MVLQDDFDIVALAAFEAQPAGLSPIAAFRAARRRPVTAMTAGGTGPVPGDDGADPDRPGGPGPGDGRIRPDDRESSRRRSAKRAGRDPDDFAVRNMAGAMIGVIMSATMPWAEGHHTADMFRRIDAALAHLEAGLPL